MIFMLHYKFQLIISVMLLIVNMKMSLSLVASADSGKAHKLLILSISFNFPLSTEGKITSSSWDFLPRKCRQPAATPSVLDYDIKS